MVVQKDTIVPARSETVLSAKVQFRKVPDSFVDADWCTEIGEIRNGLQVSRTLVPSDIWRDIPVRVMNMGVSDVKLQMNSVLSNLEQVEVLSLSDQESERVNKVSICEESDAPEYIKKLVEGVDESVPESELQALEAILMSYINVFSKDENDLGQTDIIMHYIDTGDAKPVRQQLRKFPPA